MSSKTIAKFSAFVIFVSFAVLLSLGCSHTSSRSKQYDPDKASQSDYGKPVVVGTIKSGEINESSGFTASKCQPDIFWTHNDSGDDAFIFAVNTKGDHLGTWKVQNARNDDWEDISEFKDSTGKCFIYIGEIGNNKDKRTEQAIYRVKEPSISPEASNTSRKNPLVTESADMMKFSYPDSPHDSETLIVNPKTSDIYVLTKRLDGPSGVYKIKPDFTSGAVAMAERIAELAVPSVPNGLLTGGAASPDGKRVVVCDYSMAYELILPGNSNNFDDIWKQKPIVVDMGDRPQGEAVTYSADGNAIFATSEKKNSPIIEAERRK